MGVSLFDRPPRGVLGSGQRGGCRHGARVWGGRETLPVALGRGFLAISSRHVTHVAVLALSAGLLCSGLWLRGGGRAPAAAEMLVRSAAAFTAGQYYDKPVAPPGSIPALPTRTVTLPATAPLAAVAQQYQRPATELAWANEVPAGTPVPAGQPLLIPPGQPTVLVRVLPGETLAAVAARFHVSVGVVLDYNALPSSQALQPGRFLLMPRAVSPTSLPSADFVPLRPGVPQVAPQPPGPDPFPWGQCTYWVALHTYVPWQGNAVNWWLNARAYHRPEGQVPVVGAIAVFANGYYGHVALVTRTLPNGSWIQSEMNVAGVGVVDHRHLFRGQDQFVGFIY